MIQMIIFQAAAAFGAIMLLLVFAKLFFHAHDVMLFAATFAFGLFYAAFIERRAELLEGAIIGAFYASATYGLYMLIKKLSKLYRHSKEGPFR
ncbi:hypothetical protein NIE88_05490 [Sporolactobacillus shoreicorticis]|uniref:Uncharacterized protein n=1 Tax=Sporolactobacillus shoreicorticis TaxID=1923877 RepID=A0ABW5RYQ9_9BACL|nr:hypothetical protein [Sporolactobacillus shoreicorticis]MCO7125226.1 hypothetical protein [Sporolactobacillus shoreicorticis]